MVIVKVLDFMI